LNFALALILICSVSLTKLRLTNKAPTIPTVTFRGYIKGTSTKALVPIANLGSAKITFVPESGPSYSAKIVGDGIYEVTLPIGTYRRKVTVDGFKPVETKICIRTSASAENPRHTISLDEIPVPKPVDKKTIPIADPLLFTITGLIKDSTTNKIINDKNATVTFVNTATKTEYKATVLPGGVYSVDKLPEGKYNISASLAKHADFADTRQISASSDETNKINIILLSPIISGWRVVLTWGATPLDLDAHVALPDGNNEVNFDNKKSKDGLVTLDVDAKLGFGPETVSFVDPAPGIYKYYVNRYTNDATLQKSNAKVVVYHGDKIYKQFTVPTDGDATLDNWYVFDIDATNNVLNEVNQLLSGSSSSGF